MRVWDLKGRLTGLSVVGVGGASWQPREPDRALAQRILTFLEDRRVLYSPWECELPEHCVASVLEIRRFLTHELGAAGDRPAVTDNLRAMRAACRQFLDQTAPVMQHHHGPIGQGTAEWIFNQSLGELRARVGTHIAVLADRFGLEVEDGLERTLPAAPSKADDAEWLFEQFDRD